MDLNTAVESSLSLIATKARLAGVNVAKELAGDLPRILGNTNQIQQVVINLASNALDALSEGGKLTIKTESLVVGPLSWVCLRIADTGTGIRPEVLNRIFEPFFTTKGVGKGTGLGLSLVHEIVKNIRAPLKSKAAPGLPNF